MMTDRPLRVLHLTARSFEGGLSRYLYDLARGMRRQGHDVTIAGARGVWHDLFEQEGLPWLDVPLDGGAVDLWRSYRQLSQFLRDHPQDVVHSHYRKSMFLADCLARRHGVATLSTLHVTGIPMSRWHRWATCFGQHVHAPSTKARRWLIEVTKVPASRITVIPHGVDVERFAYADAERQCVARHRLGLPQDVAIAAFVSRFTPQKNPLWMVDLAEAARAAQRPFLVVLMGSGELEAEIQRRVQHSGLDALVRVLPYGDPYEVYAACDGVLMPSNHEGFGLTATEAMSVGRAVLRTDTAGAEEQIPTPELGRVVPVEHASFVREALEFMSDRDALARMGLRAAEHVREHLTLASQIDRTVDLYRRLAPVR